MQCFNSYLTFCTQHKNLTCSVCYIEKFNSLLYWCFILALLCLWVSLSLSSQLPCYTNFDLMIICCTYSFYRNPFAEVKLKPTTTHDRSAPLICWFRNWAWPARCCFSTALCIACGMDLQAKITLKPCALSWCQAIGKTHSQNLWTVWGASLLLCALYQIQCASCDSLHRNPEFGWSLNGQAVILLLRAVC